MKYFLASTLIDSDRLQEIWIVDLNASEIAARLRMEGSGYGSHFKAFLDPRDGDWSEHLGSQIFIL